MSVLFSALWTLLGFWWALLITIALIAAALWMLFIIIKAISGELDD